MLGKSSLKKNQKLRTEEIIAIQDIILKYIQMNDWKDYQDFARVLTEKILQKRSRDKSILEKIIIGFSHPFFIFNEISKKGFSDRFPFDRVIHRLKNIPELTQTPIKVTIQQVRKERSKVTFEDIFPEIRHVGLKTAKSLVSSLDIKERIIQDALRDTLREKGATNMVERKSESSLEIADLEDFTLDIGRRSSSFTSVVKGYRSISGLRVSFEDIAHQIMKANDTNPDHILLVLAKGPKDTVVTRLVKYGKDCGNRNLVIIVDPVDLARFLRITGII